MPTPLVTLEALARHLAQMNALSQARLAALSQPRVCDDEPKLDVFAGSRKAYTEPLWCSACGARYSQDCECPRYEIPLAGSES